MFKEVSPSNQPSKDVPFTPEKIEKTDTEKKTEEVFIEKELSGEKTEISQKKQKLLDEMNQLKFDVSLGYKKNTEIREKVKDFMKSIESIPEEIQSDSIFMKKVFDWAISCKKDDIYSMELNRSILMLMKMKFLEKILTNNPEIFQEIAKLNTHLVIEFFNELAKERADSPLNNEEFLFIALGNYDIDGFPEIEMSTEFKKRIFAKNPTILDETMKEILADSKKLKNYLLEYQPKPIVKILGYCSKNVFESLAKDKELQEYILNGIVNNGDIYYDSNKISFIKGYYPNIKDIFETENLDENELINLAKIHPACIPKKFEKDKDFIFKMIRETESPVSYFSKYECKLDLSDDLIIEAVKITPKVLLISAFNKYVLVRGELIRKLKKEDISCVLYLMPKIITIDDKKKFFEFLNKCSDTDLDKLEEEALSIMENEEKVEYLRPPFFRKPMTKNEEEEESPPDSSPPKSGYFLSAVRDVKLKRNIKKGENLFFKF